MFLQLSAGAVCQTLLIAAQAEGYAAQWLTEWTAFDPDVRAALDCSGEHDQIAGYIYIGGKATNDSDRPRPDPEAVISRWPS